MEAATPCRVAARASPPKFANLGNANAAKIPKITITMINSIKVKPLCCLFMVQLLFTFS